MTSTTRRTRSTVDKLIRGATLDLFADSGVDGARIETIARRAGVAVSTVSRRGRNPADILTWAIDSSAERIPALAGDDRDPAGLLEQSVELLVNALANPRFRGVVTRLRDSATQHPFLMAACWDRFLRPRARALRELLAQAHQGGALRESSNVDSLTTLLVGGLLRHALSSEPITAEQAREHVRELYRELGLLR